MKACQSINKINDAYRQYVDPKAWHSLGEEVAVDYVHYREGNRAQ